MSGIVSGQDSSLQIGLGAAGSGIVWAANKAPQFRLPYMSESFKGAPNYKASEALVGAKTTSRMDVMSQKATGGFKTYLAPDIAKILIYAALGKALPIAAPSAAEQAAPISANAGQKKHSFTPIPSGLCRNLPHLIVEVDRLLEKALYPGFKMNTASLSAAAEDYVYFECDGPAFLENLQNPLVSGKIVNASAWVQATGILTLPASIFSSVGSYGGVSLVGRLMRLTSGCSEYVFKISVAAGTTAVPTFTLVTWPTTGGTMPGVATPTFFDGWTWEILDWAMTPADITAFPTLNTAAVSAADHGTTPLQLQPLTSKEFFKFVHGRLYIEGGVTTNKILGAIGDGRTGETIPGLPFSTTFSVGTPLIVEGKDYLGMPAAFIFTGASAVSTVAGLLTFAAASGAGAVINIYAVNGAPAMNTGWALYTETYEEVTDVKLNITNNIKDGKFGANGSPYQIEMQPQGREFTLDCSMDFTSRYSALRRRKMNQGSPCFIQLIFSTSINDVDGTYNSSVDSTGTPYKLVITMPSCYLMDGIPNISGADQPTVSAKFQAREIPGVFEALTIDIYDDTGTNGSTDAAAPFGSALTAGFSPSTRVDGLT